MLFVIGFGAGSDMMKNMNSNRNQTRAANRKKANLASLGGINSDATKTIKKRELDADDFLELRSQLLADKKRQKIKIIATIGIVLILVVLFWKFL